MKQISSSTYAGWNPYETVENRREQENVATLKKMKAIQDVVQVDNSFDPSFTEKGAEFEPYISSPKKKAVTETCVTRMLKTDPAARKIAEGVASKSDVNSMAYTRIPVTSKVLQALREKLPQKFSNWPRKDKIALFTVGLQIASILFIVKTLLKRSK